ncbi:MAG: ThiF family adenylyltransferase [Planctomycetota bacterium]
MDRYSRQRLFSHIGDAGQERLRASRVTLIGCGALGTHIAQHLARAGVGFLRICDRDFVELDNLQRQVLFDEDDARRRLPKAVAAADKLQRINHEVRIEARVTDVTAHNVLELIDGADLVLDGTDNFSTRFLINEACVSANLPWVYGGCVAAHGMVLAVLPGETACFACLVPGAPGPGRGETCDTVGVIGPVVAVVAGLQAAEAFKILVGDRQAVGRALVTVDLWNNELRALRISREVACPVCVRREFPVLRSPRAEGTTTVLCGRNAVQVSPPLAADLDLAELERRLSSIGPTRKNDYVLVFGQDDLEATLFRDGRAVIKGTADPAVARSFYARYVGM